MSVLKIIESIIDKHISHQDVLCSYCDCVVDGKILKEIDSNYVTSGIFSNVWAIDFFSFYPSIMYTFNIFPDTILCNSSAIVNDKVGSSNNVEDFLDLGNGCVVYKKSVKRSKLCDFIYFLLCLKRDCSGKFEKNIDYKVLLNSFYGVFLNKYFKYYCPIISIKVLELGRKILRKSVWIVNYILNNNFEDLDKCNLSIDYVDNSNISHNYVIYSDTDSIFVNMNSFPDRGDLLLKTLNQMILRMIQENFNISLNDIFLYLKVDGVYEKFLNYGVKKKYFALGHDSQIIIKGIHSFGNDFIYDVFKKFLYKYIFVDNLSIKEILEAIKKLYLKSCLSLQHNDHKYFAKTIVNLSDYVLNKKSRKYFPLYLFEKFISCDFLNVDKKEVECSIIPISCIHVIDFNKSVCDIKKDIYDISKIYVPTNYSLYNVMKKIEVDYEKNFELLFGREIRNICSLFFEIPSVSKLMQVVPGVSSSFVGSLKEK